MRQVHEHAKSKKWTPGTVRLAALALVAPLLPLLPQLSSPAAAAETTIVLPAPAPDVEESEVGFTDTHLHMFSHDGFGGLAMWGSPVDPLYDTNGLTIADFAAYPNFNDCNPGLTATQLAKCRKVQEARARALPTSDYLYVDGMGRSADGVQRLTATSSRAAGACRPPQGALQPQSYTAEMRYTDIKPFPTKVNGVNRGICISGPGINVDLGNGTRVAIWFTQGTVTDVYPTVDWNPNRCPAGTGTEANPCYRFTIHGTDGKADTFNAMAFGGPDDHAVSGYPFMGYRGPILPDSLGWPSWDVLTMQAVYWEWLKRAHDHGLDLIVVPAVNSEFFCAEAVRRTDFGCLDDAAAERQLDEAYALQNYIDTLSGGDTDGDGDKDGFFRIVTSPAEAREAFADGELAVVLGAETDHQWFCKVNTDENPGPGCDESAVTTGLNHWYDRGMRVFFPVHRLNNAFGGAAVYNAIFDIENMALNDDDRALDAIEWFDLTTDCEPHIEWRSNVREVVFPIRVAATIALFGAILPLPGALHLAALVLPVVIAVGIPAMAAGVALLQNMPGEVNTLNAVDVLGRLVFTIPEAPGEASYFAKPSPNCNHMGMTDLGRELVDQLMSKRMIIDVDHMSNRVLDEFLGIAEARNYAGIEAGHTGLVGAGWARSEFPITVHGRRCKDENFACPHVNWADVYTTTTHTEYNKTDAQVQRIAERGGQVSLVFNSGKRDRIADRFPADGITFKCGNSSEAWAQVYLYATQHLGLDSVGIGSDMNGWFQTPAPRFGAEACGRQQGHGLADTQGDYDPGTYNLGYAPQAPRADQIKYDGLKDYEGRPLPRHEFGLRDYAPCNLANSGCGAWDFNVNGFVNVGAYPDFVADLQAIGLTKQQLKPLFNAAEGYVDMWERVEDTEAPEVRCGTPTPGLTYSANVTIQCVAWDHGSGIDGADGEEPFTFEVSTHVPSGLSDQLATTDDPPGICDNASLEANCVDLPPFELSVDRTVYTNAITTPETMAFFGAGFLNRLITTSDSRLAGQPATCTPETCATISLEGELPANITFTFDPATGTGTLFGPSPTPGDYPLTIRAEFPEVGDRPAETLTQPMLLEIGARPGNPTCEIDGVPEPCNLTFEQGVPKTVKLIGTGHPKADSIRLFFGTLTGQLADGRGLPAGVTWNPQTHTLSGAPEPGSGGEYPFVLVSQNKYGAQIVERRVRVVPGLTSPSAAVFTVGEAGTFTVEAVQEVGGGPDVDLSATGVPPGLTFVDNGNATATLAGTPDANTGGLHSVTVKGKLANGKEQTQVLAVTILEPPSLSLAAPGRFVEGVPGAWVVQADGFPPPSLLSVGELPEGLVATADAQSPGTVTLHGSAAKGTAGQHVFDLVLVNDKETVDTGVSYQIVPAGLVRGKVFADPDGSGPVASGTGRSDVEVTAYYDHDGDGKLSAADKAEGSLVQAASTVTAPDGTYELAFDNGTYVVCATPGGGWFPSFPASGATGCPEGRGHAVDLTNGEVLQGRDFGSVGFGTGVPLGRVTSSSCPTTSTFDLSFLRHQVPSKYRLSASRPGTLRYDVAVPGKPTQVVDVTLRIPYPFVTRGSNPVRLHDRGTLSDAGCFTPGTPISRDGFTISRDKVALGTHDGRSPGRGKATIRVQGRVPDSGLLVVTVDLDYGLEGSSSWAKDSKSGATKGKKARKVVIKNSQAYPFSFQSLTAQGKTTLRNANRFVDSGSVSGAIWRTGSEEPVARATVRLLNGAGKQIAKARTDSRGVFKFKHAVRTKTVLKVKVPGRPARKVTVTPTRPAVVEFALPASLSARISPSAGDVMLRRAVRITFDRV